MSSLAIASRALTVTDVRGNTHVVLAARRIDSFRWLVIHETSGCQPFVVHSFNEQDGGFHCGHYCETYARAVEVFNADKRGL